MMEATTCSQQGTGPLVLDITQFQLYFLVHGSVSQWLGKGGHYQTNLLVGQPCQLFEAYSHRPTVFIGSMSSWEG